MQAAFFLCLLSFWACKKKVSRPEGRKSCYQVNAKIEQCLWHSKSEQNFRLENYYRGVQRILVSPSLGDLVIRHYVPQPSAHISLLREYDEIHKKRRIAHKSSPQY